MKFTLSFVFFLVFGFSFLVPPPLYAQRGEGPRDWNFQQSGRCVTRVTAGNEVFTDIATIQGFECLFFNILQVIVIIAGLAFLFMFITGGFKYLFSGSEQKAVAAASSTLTSAIIGLVGIIASWLILKLIQDFTGINVTIFTIPGGT